VYALSGKLILSQKSHHIEIKLDLKNLAAGIYHISIKTTAAVSGVQLVVQ
jgi:hypothetical protein